MTPIMAGRDGKYGQIYVERSGNTGFSDSNEPMMLFRAQDEWALHVLESYIEKLIQDERVPREHISAVERQIKAFDEWRNYNAEKVRVPGTKA